MTPITIDPLPDYRRLRQTVTTAVVLLILLTVAFSIWKAATEYNLTVDSAEKQNRGYASALKEHAERTLGETDIVLQDVIEHLQKQKDFEQRGGEHLRAFLASKPRKTPQIGSIVLVNKDGILFDHSLDTPLRQANVSDRDYFLHHRDHPSDSSPFLSKPLKSRINGKWRITISRPLQGKNGDFAGLVAIALDIEYFRSFFEGIDLGSRGKILLVRKDGEFLLAQPYKETDFSIDFRKSHLMRTHLPRSPKGTFHIERGKALLESSARIVSYDSLKDFPVVVTINISKDDLLKQWKQNTTIQAALLAAVTAGLWMLLLLLMRQLRRMEESYRIQLEQQKEIASASETWQTTFDAVEDSIWVMDLERRILRANKATESLFGSPRDLVTGKLCCEVAHNRSTPLPECPFQKMIDTGHRASMQLKLDERWYEVSVDPVKNESGKITGAVHIITDITDHTLMEMQLRQAQKMEAIGHLAGGIAHDFNNMLTPILGYAEMVAARLPSGDPLSGKVSGITAAAHKAKDLTQQLLSFGRRQPLSSDIVDLNDVIESFHIVLRRTIRESIEIKLVLDPEGAYVKGDRSQIEQIILNMTVNAQDALSGKGEIAIETCKVYMEGENVRLHPGMVEGDYILLSFRDNGCGMSSDVLAHIFEPFFTTKPVGHGTGLGLATVYGIVKQHNGHIGVTSKESHGTTFRIYFPSSSTVPLMKTAETAAEKETGHDSKTILLVEDNEMVLDMVRDMLEGYGYTVLTATGAVQAIELATEHRSRIDLMVSDVVMPGMSGPELYEQLVVRIPSLKVVYISGYPMNPSIRKGTLEEEVSYLQKPFTAEALLERIRMVG